MKQFAFFLLSFAFLINASAENGNEIDSLKVLLSKTTSDSAKAKIQLLLSDKLVKNESSTAKGYALEALSYYKKIKDEKNIANSLGNAAFAFLNLGEFENAIDYNLQALTLYEKLKDKKSLGYVQNKLGAVYYYLGNYGKAIEYWKQSLSVSEGIDDKESQSFLLNNIGLIYEKQGKYDSALVNHRQSLKIKEDLNDRAGISGSINNIGNIFFHKKEYKRAIEHWKLALNIKEELDEKPGIINSLQNIGYGYYHLKDYPNALEYINKGLKVANEINHKYYLKEGYIKLADVYFEMKNFEKAYEYQQLFWRMKDTIFNEQNQKQMAELETKYQTEKKQKEIEVQNLQLNEQKAEIKSQRIAIFASAGGALLLLAFGVFVFRAYKQKQKANLLLKKQKVEIEIQKGIIEEKNHDITDSIRYAKHIQDSILPEKEKIKEALPESFVLFMPKDIVSGDFYWFAGIDERTSLIACCDCTGHGVPGAFMSMIGSNMLTKIVAEQKITTPFEILNRLNGEIKSALKQKTDYESSKDGMDIALLKISLEGGNSKMEFASANRPLIYFENWEMKEIIPDKTAIGGFTDDCYLFANHTLELQKGTMFYMFSDGYADQFGGPKGKKFMLKNLKELFKNIKNLPVAEQEKTLREVFLSWKGEREQVDDVLVIGIRV